VLYMTGDDPAYGPFEPTTAGAGRVLRKPA
jgi:hypothetical protein